MKRLVLAAVLHVATTNNCERATDLKPEHFCAKPTNPDALRSAIPTDADALPLKSSAPPSLNVIQGSVAKQKARLLRKANTEGAPLVWVLDDYVGIGNALDAYVRAVIEARHRRRSLIIKSPILRNLCRIVGVRCINQIVAARLSHRTHPTHWLICAQVACEGLVGAKRDDLSRTERLCLASSHQAESDHCVYYTTFGWRNGKYPPDYDLSPHNGLTAARRAILREFLPRREHGELLKRFLPILEKAFVGASVEDAVAPSQRYAVALHLRTLDFIEGKNATDAAAFDWLQTRKARFKWTCLDSAPVKRAFARAIEEAFPGVAAEYFDGIEPPRYNVWFAKTPSFNDWLSLTTTVCDWLALANSKLVIGVKGTTSVQHLPSSFARTASIISGANFDDLAGLERDQRSVTCCAWYDHRDW